MDLQIGAVNTEIEHLLRESNIRNLTVTQLLIVIINATWDVNACYYEVSYMRRRGRSNAALTRSTGQLYKPLAKNTSAVSIPIDLKWEHRKNFADQSTRRFCKPGFVCFHECKLWYIPAEDLKRRIRNDLTDAYETL